MKNQSQVFSKEEKEEIYNIYEMHSKPVALSLAILNRNGLLEHVEGRTDEYRGLLPFSVKLTSGKYICRRKELHKIAQGYL